MADAGRRRDDAEVVERGLAPAQEAVALLVSLVVAVGVDVEGAVGAEGVDLDRVVDHEVDGDARVDPGGVAAEVVHRVAHRGEVDDGGHAGEVLHQHAGGLEGDLVGGLGLRVPARDRLDVVGGDRLAVLEPQDVLEQHLQRIRQPGDVELLLQRVEPVDLVGLARDLELVACSEAVIAHAFIIPDRLPAESSGHRLQAGVVAVGAADLAGGLALEQDDVGREVVLAADERGADAVDVDRRLGLARRPRSSRRRSRPRRRSSRARGRRRRAPRGRAWRAARSRRSA